MNMPVDTAKSTSKNTDSKGRIALGPRFANRTVLIRQISETAFEIKLARVIPEDELWLYKNREAMQSVQEGLTLAARGKSAKKPPDLEADSALAGSIADEQ